MGTGRTSLGRRRLLLGTLPAAALLLAGCAGPDRDVAPGNATPGPATGGGSRPLALVYNGPQGCDDCPGAVADLLRAAPRPFDVEFVGADADHPLTAGALARARLYVQPGGGADLAGAWAGLSDAAEAVRSWVRGGGSYLGLCFGAYLAGRDPGFDLLDGDVLGYTDTPGATVHDGRDTVVPVDWHGTPRHMYFQDGPAFVPRPGSGATVLGTYPNGTAAVVVAPYGRGRVGLSGPHPEADATWYADKGLVNPDGARTDLAYELIEATVPRG